MKYGQKLPPEAEASLDAYIERIGGIKWFKPSADLKRETVDTAVKAALSAFGITASIEYRNLKTPNDWDAARDATWDAAWGATWDAARDATRDAAWGACDVLATHTPTYKLDTPFVKLVDIWEMGLYPVGIVNGKFIVYVPPCKMEFRRDYKITNEGMTTKEFIEKAIEGGWKPKFKDDAINFTKTDKYERAQRIDVLEFQESVEIWWEYERGGGIQSKLSISRVLLDPLAWQAVGKVDRWGIRCPLRHDREYMKPTEKNGVCWQCRMHAMIDAIAEGKTIEQFLETL